MVAYKYPKTSPKPEQPKLKYLGLNRAVPFEIWESIDNMEPSWFGPQQQGGPTAGHYLGRYVSIEEFLPYRASLAHSIHQWMIRRWDTHSSGNQLIWWRSRNYDIDVWYISSSWSGSSYAERVSRPTQMFSSSYGLMETNFVRIQYFCRSDSSTCS